MLTTRDVGARVVVRRVVGARDGRPLYSDVLGDLVEFAEAHVTVRDATGRLITVPRDEIAAAKPVPPRSATRREIVALERVAAAGWPAREAEQLGEWLLRAASDWTNRANSVLPLGDPGMPLPEALRQVHDWYAARGLAPRFAVPLPGFGDVDRELDARGWVVTHTVLVQAAELAAVRDAAERGAAERAGHSAAGHDAARRALPAPRLAARPDEDWLAVAVHRKGPMPDGAYDVLVGARDPVFAALRDESGDLLATGRGVVDDGWLGLSLMEVAPHARRRGLARHVVAALAEWAAERGAERAYLQVESNNEAAIGLYASLGFTTHHTYVNRAAPVHRP
ncbi:MAG: GNAT family N-acetyltransferase [Micromonosporaceae bacterium]|nr:GNAT family N-acetyltransferase [Micromonosporaceae bacterium]